MCDNALEIKNLTKTYESFKLDNLNLTLPKGCVLGLIGENGAGKSTTIKLILDIVKKDSGTVTIMGRDNQDNLQITKQDIGVVLDEVGLPECLDAVQIEKIMTYTFKNWDKKLYFSYLEKFSTPKNKQFKALSRGTKMKLGIAVALSHHPKLLILDEATSGLDPVIRDEIVDIFSEFTRNENHSVLISSHIVSDLEKICDYIAFLHKGRLMLFDEKDALMEKYGLIQCSKEDLEILSPDAVKAKKETPYNVTALVLRDKVPSSFKISPVNIEELFIFMAKERD